MNSSPTAAPASNLPINFARSEGDDHHGKESQEESRREAGRQKQEDQESHRREIGEGKEARGEEARAQGDAPQQRVDEARGPRPALDRITAQLGAFSSCGEDDRRH